MTRTGVFAVAAVATAVAALGAGMWLARRNSKRLKAAQDTGRAR